MTWWVPLLSFLGALAGAAGAAWVALRGQQLGAATPAASTVDLALLPGDNGAVDEEEDR